MYHVAIYVYKSYLISVGRIHYISFLITFVSAFWGLHPRKLTWIPKMIVWKMYLLLNMAIFGIYVKVLGCTKKLPTSTGLGQLGPPRVDVPPLLYMHGVMVG